MAFLDQISKNLAGYGKEAAKKAKDTNLIHWIRQRRQTALLYIE